MEYNPSLTECFTYIHFLKNPKCLNVYSKCSAITQAMIPSDPFSKRPKSKGERKRGHTGVLYKINKDQVFRCPLKCKKRQVSFYLSLWELYLPYCVEDFEQRDQSHESKGEEKTVKSALLTLSQVSSLSTI